jgi:integration host factor subunit beta
MSDEDSRTITKRELVNRIAEETGQTKVVVREILQRFLDSVIDELVDGNRLEFRDFGVFEVRERPARVAQNPRTLEKVPVPAKHVVRFKAGRIMRERVCDEMLACGEGNTAGSKPSSTAPKAGMNGSSAGAHGSKVNGAEAADSRREGTEAEKGKPAPPTPPPAKPGSPF